MSSTETGELSMPVPPPISGVVSGTFERFAKAYLADFDEAIDALIASDTSQRTERERDRSLVHEAVNGFVSWAEVEVARLNQDTERIVDLGANPSGPATPEEAGDPKKRLRRSFI